MTPRSAFSLALAAALALPFAASAAAALTPHPVKLDDGRSFALDLPADLDIVPVAQGLKRVRFFARSPHAGKIELREGPALETMKTLEPASFGLVFIDADKGNYVNYYEASLPLLAPGGTIVVDNTLWSGRVLDPKERDDHAIVAFNEHVRRDERVTCVMLTVRDGVTLIRKR